MQEVNIVAADVNIWCRGVALQRNIIHGVLMKKGKSGLLILGHLHSAVICLNSSPQRH